MGEVRSRTKRYFGTEKSDGLTLLSGSGQWRDCGGNIEIIRALYKRAFRQKSVWWVDSPQRVSF